MVKVAAVGDIHAGGPDDDRLDTWLAEADREADLILLAGDLTLRGEPEELAALVEAVRGLETPMVAVLGNHDWHANRTGELVTALSDAGECSTGSRSSSTWRVPGSGSWV